MDGSDNIMLDKVPMVLKEKIIKPIWPRGLVKVNGVNNMLNVFHCDPSIKGLNIIIRKLGYVRKTILRYLSIMSVVEEFMIVLNTFTLCFLSFIVYPFL